MIAATATLHIAHWCGELRLALLPLNTRQAIYYFRADQHTIPHPRHALHLTITIIRDAPARARIPETPAGRRVILASHNKGRPLCG